MFLIILCLLFNQDVYAKENYSYELKQFIIAFKPALDMDKEFRKHIFDQSRNNKLEFKTAIRQCALNDLDMFYENMIPIFKKHYSILELEILNQSLQSKTGEIYLKYIAGIILRSSLTQEQVEAIKMLEKTDVITKLEPLTVELIEKVTEYSLPFRDFCLEKYLPEK